MGSIERQQKFDFFSYDDMLKFKASFLSQIKVLAEILLTNDEFRTVDSNEPSSPPWSKYYYEVRSKLLK